MSDRFAASCLLTALLLARGVTAVSAQVAPAPAEGAAQPEGAQIEIEEDVQEVEVSGEGAQPQPAAPEQPAASAQSADASAQRIESLEARTRELEAKLAELAARQPAQQAAAATDAAEPEHAADADADEGADEADSPYGLVISGYVQAQYESSQFSEDEVQQSGQSLNRDRFVLRRARLRLDRTWRHAALVLELDANTVRGATVGARRAYGVLRLPGPTPDAPPYVALTAGLQDIAFGHELAYGAQRRVFMERSLASLAFFPGETDVGATVWGGIGPIRYAVAVLNGQPVDDRAGGLSVVDPNAAKDVVIRAGAETEASSWSLGGGVSFLTGRGFSAGSTATKNQIEWEDLDEDAFVDAIEIVARPGQAARPSENFDRWAVGADLRAGLRTSLGWSQLFAEITLAENLDRGLFVANPVEGPEARELGYAIGIVQEVTRYGLLGFRTDFYDGNSDFTDSRRGMVVPADQSVRTFSPLAGLVLPDIARLVFQYDFIVDKLARDVRGVPTDLRNDQWTLRLQVAM